MNKDEAVKLAMLHTSLLTYISMNHKDANVEFVEFSIDSLLAFANACEKIGMEKAANKMGQ